MSTHADALLQRLPTLYQDGDLVRGLAQVLGLQLEIADEEALAVQRGHWFDATVERAEAAGLGSLLDIAPLPWQGLGEYRAWLHALRTARLEFGAVSRPALGTFTQLYVEAFERANRIDVAPPFGTWGTTFQREGNALVENPPRRRLVRLGGPSAAEPLLQRQVSGGGLDPAAVSWLLTGGSMSEYVPVVVNRTTGAALAFLGELRPGDRLWVFAAPDGTASAQLNRSDVTRHLRGITRVAPGEPWAPDDVTSSPRAVTLRPGRNDLWFLPVAHFDAPGLDRALLALAGLDLTEGRFDASAFDQALYYQDPAAYVDLVWDERPPATVRVDVDGGTLRSPAGHLDEALQERGQLEGSLGTGVAGLAAAGVAAQVRLRPLHDSQRQLDQLTLISGTKQHEVGTVGIDTLTDSGGLFGVTALGDSTYQ